MSVRARKVTAFVIAALIAGTGVAASAAIAAPAFAVNAFTTWTAPAPATGTISLQLPDPVPVAYGDTISIPVQATCTDPKVLGLLPVIMLFDNQSRIIYPLPSPQQPSSWQGDSYTGTVQIPVDSSTTVIKLGSFNADCMGAWASVPVMTLHTDLSTRPADNAPWVRTDFGTSNAGRAATGSLLGPATDTYAYAVTTGTLPAGLTLASSGALNGITTVVGDFTVGVTATDDAGHQWTSTVVGSVGDVHPWDKTSMQAFTNTYPYYDTVVAPIYSGAYYVNYEVTAGALPAGLTIDIYGNITGVPLDVAGVYNYEVTATDQLGYSYTTEESTILRDAPAANAPWVNSTVPDLAIGQTFSVPLQGPVGDTYTYAVTAGSPPLGSAVDVDGTYSGQITDIADDYSFDVTATDPNGLTWTTTVWVTVSAAVPVWSDSPIADLYLGIPATTAVSASGDGVVYDVENGSLPAGLTLNTDGTITGTPAIADDYSVTIRATLGNEFADRQFNGTVHTAAADLAMNFQIGDRASGATISVDAVGIQPGTEWSLELHSTPSTIGSGTVAASGLVSQLVTIPAGTPAGAHTLILTATAPGGAVLTTRAWFTIGANGTILALSLSGPTAGLAALASTGAPDESGAILVGVLALLAGLVLLVGRRRRA
jgi:hypothetical protein